jgi:hypothetical protein
MIEPHHLWSLLFRLLTSPGPLRQGMYHGHGVYFSADCDEYDGEWRCDKMHGVGKITQKDTGDVWEGTFVDGLKDGVGTYTSASSGAAEQREYRAGELVA